MKIAVTGATGGLGRSLVEHLLARGHTVVSLGRNREIGSILETMGVHFHACEIDDERAVTEALSGCDQVVHSAGLAAPWGKWEQFERANVTGTKTVLQAMRTNGIHRLVHISTPSVYFDGRARTDVKESDPIPEPTNLYAKSKLMADELVKRECEARDLSAVLVRPRSIYGPYDRTILPRMLRVMKKGFFPLPDGGHALVDVTAVENVTHFIELALNSPKTFKADAFNVTNGEPMPVRDLLAMVADAAKLKVKFVPVPSSLLYGVGGAMEIASKLVTGEEPQLTRHSVQTIAVSQTLSIAKAQHELGYRPKVSTRDSIRIS